MLTVKHVHRNGSHKMWQTRWVSAREPRTKGCEYQREVFFMNEPDLTHIEITDGDVYVMNDAGKTVQQYNLTDERPMKPLAEPEQESEKAA